MMLRTLFRRSFSINLLILPPTLRPPILWILAQPKTTQQIIAFHTNGRQFVSVIPCVHPIAATFARLLVQSIADGKPYKYQIVLIEPHCTNVIYRLFLPHILYEIHVAEISEDFLVCYSQIKHLSQLLRYELNTFTLTRLQDDYRINWIAIYTV